MMARRATVTAVTVGAVQPAATLPTFSIEPVFLRVSDAMKVLGLGRTKIYELIRSGRLRACQEGGARLIPVDAISEYKALLIEEAKATR